MKEDILFCKCCEELKFWQGTEGKVYYCPKKRPWNSWKHDKNLTIPFPKPDHYRRI